MNKYKYVMISALSVVLFIAGGITYLLNNDQNKDRSSLSAKKTACQIFALNNAREIIGLGVKDTPNKDQSKSDSVKSPSNISTNNSSSEPVSISSCTYIKGGETKPSDRIIPVTLTIRESTREQALKEFETAKKAQVTEPIQGYGQDAFWRAGKSFSGGDSGELRIVNDRNIILISAASTDLELVKKIAGVVMENL